MEKVQEYEKKGGKFKINGHRYYFITEYKSKNKYFRCIKKNCSGSVTITPSRRIVNKVVHICNCKGTVDKPSEDNELEKVQEYEKIGGKFKMGIVTTQMQNVKQEKNIFSVYTPTQSEKNVKVLFQ